MGFGKSITITLLFIIGSATISYLVYRLTGIWFLFLLIPFFLVFSWSRKRKWRR